MHGQEVRDGESKERRKGEKEAGWGGGGIMSTYCTFNKGLGVLLDSC